MTTSGTTPRRTSSGQHVGGVALERDRARLARAPALVDARERLVERSDALVDVARGQPPLDPRRDRPRRRGRSPPFIVTASGWAPPMPPRPAVTTSRPASVPPKCRRADFGERLVGALQDALRADVDPAAGRHLAVHRQAAVLEIAEDVPGRPGGHQQGVGDDHARRPRMRAEDGDRLAGLHDQRLVVLEAAQRARRSRRTPASCARPCRSRRRRSRSSGRSATSGSRLFISMRSAASCGHPLQERVGAARRADVAAEGAHRLTTDPDRTR